MFRVSHRGDDQSLLQFSTTDPLDWIGAEQFGRGIAAGTLRREWTWLAFLDDDPGRAPLARAVWWGPVGSVHPVELRCLLVEQGVPHPELWGAALIRSAHRAFSEGGALFPPVFVIRAIDVGHRDAAAAAAAAAAGAAGAGAAAGAAAGAVAWRHEAAAQAGVTVVVRASEPVPPFTDRVLSVR